MPVGKLRGNPQPHPQALAGLERTPALAKAGQHFAPKHTLKQHLPEGPRLGQLRAIRSQLCDPRLRHPIGSIPPSPWQHLDIKRQRQWLRRQLNIAIRLLDSNRIASSAPASRRNHQVKIGRFAHRVSA
jgi:hypothetical protein